ncbi:hypothetical protein BBJ29_008893 [Phytophthora kernoviae]|uniref:Uncharacterized protein n=1 Tax=Phytophthora kernoviae TaxID=325452 RepID=A0A3F2RD81_9STRA|nr:hypothetical protein BBP00_00009212 [Phytophthora kernoviae]RLN69559.1 hypothetical protein BBJ29_008893 [Phytophthora kernoviae]
MITRGASASPSAPSSPTSRTDTVPSDSELPSASQEVVDVTGTEELWADTAARRTPHPPPLRGTRRHSAKAATGAALAEARKGKKKATKRVSNPASGAATKKKAASDAGRGSESDGETKPTPTASKKARKAAPSAKTLTTEAIPATKSLLKPRPDRGFDLGEFMSTFEPGLAGAESGLATATAGAPAVPSEPTPTNMVAELRALKGEVMRLQGLVAGKVRCAQDVTSGAGQARGTSDVITGTGVTAANAKGDLPPTRLECVKFQAPLAVLMIIFSGRLGSWSLTLMHFRESTEMASLENGSTNVNFASNFSASATLPTASIRCSSYEDILDAVHGLNVLGQEVWYDHMRKLTSRLRAFVAKYKSADLGNMPLRVRLTLLYANKFIGTALGHLQVDESHWWSDFCEALRAIDYQSPAWTMALVSVLSQEKAEDTSEKPSRGRHDSARSTAIPESIHHLIPVKRKGQEPCLRNVAGLSCSGGTYERCGNSRRVHNWNEHLPSRLQEWVDTTYGTRATNGRERR